MIKILTKVILQNIAIVFSYLVLACLSFQFLTIISGYVALGALVLILIPVFLFLFYSNAELFKNVSNDYVWSVLSGVITLVILVPTVMYSVHKPCACLWGSCSSPSNQQEEYISYYLNDPETSARIKDAIKEGVVVAGMCPFQAIAAAGLPGLYMVKKDHDVWKGVVPPPAIISAQCEKPDNSIIDLEFMNTTQFDSEEVVLFRVRFEKGQVVSIDKKRVGE